MKIGDLFIKLGLQKGEFDKGIDDAKQKTNAFGSAIGKIGGLIAGVFAADKLIQFGKEVFQIATQAEGVATAFYKVGSALDLDNLRRSVKGTVSDMELMKRSVMASNFGIPIQELGRLFQFAAKRAQDTGQSVDYLVDSIVMGIGRKSPLILDNLGISAIQLKSKLGEVSMEAATVADITRAVGMIAEESLTKTGRLADNLGTKVQSLSANWQNLKMTISSLFSESEVLKKDLDDWSKLIQIWQSKEISKWEKFWSSVSQVSADANFERMQILKGLEQRESTDGGILDKKPPKEDPIVKTAAEQLAAIKKVNEELEAQRILRQEFKGEKMTPMTPLYQGVDDFRLGQKSDMGGVFGNLDSHYDLIRDKFNKFSEDFNADAVAFTDELNSIIQSGIINAIESLATGLTELAMGDLSGKEFGAQILSMVGNFMIQMGIAFITFSKLFIAFQSAIGSMNGPLALGIGIALVGAGAAISTIAKKGVSSGSGGVASAPTSGYSNYSQSSGAAVLSGNVVFELDGYKLKGALNNTDRRNNLIR